MSNCISHMVWLGRTHQQAAFIEIRMVCTAIFM